MNTKKLFIYSGLMTVVPDIGQMDKHAGQCLPHTWPEQSHHKFA